MRYMFFFLGVCFQRQNLFSSLNSNAHAFKISIFFAQKHTYTRNEKLVGTNFGVWLPHSSHVHSFAISFIRSHRNINKPRKKSDKRFRHQHRQRIFYECSSTPATSTKWNVCGVGGSFFLLLLNKSRSSR